MQNRTQRPPGLCVLLFYLSLLQLHLHEEQLSLQDELFGHPMHFLPLFLALYM